MANPVTVSTRPQYLNANTLVYNMWDLRRYMDGPPPGPGVFGYEDWRVLPKQAGVNLSVDVGKTGVGLMQGWVRGSTRGGQGLYRIDNIDTTAATADTYLGQFNVDVASNGSGNPRIDIVVLEVLDAQHTGASSLAQIRVISGTPTAAATLDNRTGAAAIPTSAIILADILLASGDGTVDAADIRDRRQVPFFGTQPWLNYNIEMATFQYPDMRITDVGSWSHATNDLAQLALAVYLPRRITNCTKLRWKYTQGATANTGNYNFGVYDATGRQIVTTGVVAFTGAANSSQARAETIASTTFEAGWYYLVVGLDTATVGGTSAFLGVNPTFVLGTTINCGVPGQCFANTVGGTTLPSFILNGGFSTDVYAVAGSFTTLQMPVVTLSQT